MQRGSFLAGIALALSACSEGDGEASHGGGATECKGIGPSRPSDAAKQGPFAQVEQQPLHEKGVILPSNSLPCVPVSTGTPQNECNHHASTVAELADGSLGAVWYHGEFEKSLDSRVIWSRLPEGQSDWTAPQVVHDEPNLSDGNPAIWLHEDGTIFVFIAIIFGEGWHESKLRLVRSTDGGTSWSAPVALRDAYCWNVRHRPLRLKSGELLLPLYHECVAIPTFMRSSDDFETWEELGDMPFLDHAGQIQPALIETANGGIAAFTRDGTSKGRVHRLTSDDRGTTWTPSTPTALPNGGTSIDAVRLRNGHVVVVFNNDPEGRFPLSVALSYDDGATFATVRHINDECTKPNCAYAYPSIMQRSDGEIWVTYTHDRETIGWVRFNEAWLAEGAVAPRVNCLRTETCIEGTCLPACTTDEDCPPATAAKCVSGICQKSCTTGPDCTAGVCVSTLPLACSG